MKAKAQGIMDRVQALTDYALEYAGVTVEERQALLEDLGDALTVYVLAVPALQKRREARIARELVTVEDVVS